MSKHFSDDYTIDQNAQAVIDGPVEAFVDAALDISRDKLLIAAAELQDHRRYLMSARETVDDWKPGALINGGYLNVVKDILATAERLAGIQRSE